MKMPKRATGDPTASELELLTVVASLRAFLSRWPTLSEIGREYEPMITRQAIWPRIQRLRLKGLIEQGERGKQWGVELSHNGKLVVETTLPAVAE